MNKSKPYIGYLNSTGKYEYFRSKEEPTPEVFPYAFVVGPFRTAKAAKFTAEFGLNNPHIRCVADAERIVKEQNDN